MNKKIKHIITSALLLVGMVALAQDPPHVTVGGSVFGGGNLANVTGSTTVLINQSGAVVTEDVYGGGALANVESSSTVNVLNGNVTGNVYGGGLGRKAAGEITAIPAAVNGVVTVNIGALTGALDANGFAPSSSVTGTATIGGSVFGCNNTNGSPKDNVTVNIYKTARTTDQQTSGSGYALDQVFGGGNQANYEPSSSDKKTTVHIWTCDNTIQYVYGGGNAADVGTTSINSATDVIIDGGRIDWVFGGGNGAGASNPGANIFGDVNVDYHAGILTYLFGGSNEKGNISGSKTVNIINDGTCSNNHITELYGGSNLAPITGNVSLTMGCPSNDPVEIGALFGGSRNANITGNVTLTIEGGEYAEVFGGNNIGGIISGDVTLNLFGGTIGSAFGGNNAGGSINGKITVNMLDQGSCGLTVNNIYGGGKNAAYSPTTPGAYPEVNLIHGTVSKNAGVGGNVYGGGYGSTATVTSNPTVNIGYNSTTMTTLVSSLLPPPSTSLTTANVDVKGNVYGGGEEAPVAGSTSVTMQQASVSGLTANTNVRGDIYGGGNKADVSGSVVVNVTGGTVTQDVYGGGALADVNVTSGTLTSGASTAVTLSGGQARALYGGGLGSRETGSEVEAKVYGPVQVTVNGGTVTGSVYGCNNANGAPQSTVKVDIYGTDTPLSGYALGNVFGGGNLAGYTGTPDVTIHNCNNSIEYVYGGGNAAPVAATNVVVYGGNTIGNVFGGGNGTGVDANFVMVSENAVANIYGGTIGKVFGGNNSSGKINGTVTLNVNKQTEPGEGHTSCDMKIGEVYGGGNYAAGNAGSITIGCTGEWTTTGANNHTNHNNSNNRIGYELEGIGTVYGGANQAAISNNIELNINSGIVENVFGGNNTAGAINGNIVVNINKNNNASCAWYVGNVFGGGNEAPYSNANGYPVVNIVNGAVANNVYGGGKGSGAIVTGTPHVNVGYNSDMSSYLPAAATASVVSVGGNVYGGGDQAAVSGGTTVRVQLSSLTGASTTVSGDVYGGGALANTGGSTVTLSSGTIRNLYGGGLGDATHAAAVSGAVVVNVTGGSVTDVFGCNNANGAPTNTVTVNIEEAEANTMTVTNVYGGGNQAACNITPTVNIKSGTVSGNVYGGGNNILADTETGTLGVAGSNVQMTGGTVVGKVYGGCNQKGTVTGTSQVTISGGTLGSSTALATGTTSDVFGGGLGENTKVKGNVTVTITRASGDNPPAAPTIWGDVYGGSAKGSVNSNASNTTTVHILDGTLKTNRSSQTIGTQTIYSYTGGNVFGGGLGETNNTVKGIVNGKVFVNIGAGTPNLTTPFTVAVTGLGGNATIEGNVYGCNNSGGSPQDDVTVNIFQTNHTSSNGYEGTGYAIANVFGGGNEADYTVSGKTAYVNIYSCVNTIERVFGGGNAAAAPHVATNIQGGRINQVYGGGNGERGSEYGANIGAGIDLTIHGGNVGEFYGGSNQYGTVTGTINTNVVNDGPCESMVIDEFFCGGKYVDINGDLTTTIECSDGMEVHNLYGGCNQANITGSVVLNVYGGIYTNVYGGSKGDLSSLGTGHTDRAANIGGSVTLNLFGGTMENVFGGSNVNGNINGVIKVNVLDKEDGTCPLNITNIYGGSNMTNYTPSPSNVTSPVVNVMHIRNGVSGNVYGGSKGVEGTTVTLSANPRVNIGYDSSMSGDVPTGTGVPSVSASPRAIIAGSVFGGGDAAQVSGNTEIFLRNRAKVFGNVYGGGNMGVVTGNTKVIVNGASAPEP